MVGIRGGLSGGFSRARHGTFVVPGQDGRSIVGACQNVGNVVVVVFVVVVIFVVVPLSLPAHAVPVAQVEAKGQHAENREGASGGGQHGENHFGRQFH